MTFEQKMTPKALKYTRRQTLLGSAAMGLGAAIPFSSRALARRQGQAPNMIFILADDLGYADLSVYGRREYLTPALDRLAAEGVRFTQAYANSAVCSATRTALITGRYQDRLPIGLEQPLADRDVGLPPSHPTLPSLLRKAGYSTSLVGKWHLGALPKFGPELSGYDHFWGFRGGGVDYFSHSLMGKPDLWDDDRQIVKPGYLTDLLGSKAMEVIEEQSKRKIPFFMSLHFNAPHWPWEGPADQEESRRLAAQTGGDPFHLDGGSMATFAQMVTAMDAQIGRILAKLEELGLADNTIVIFTSDNGGERYSNTWPFSGKKTELLEGGVRIPAIVRWPGHIAPGTVSEQVIMSMDWFPTLLDIAGVAPDPQYPSDGMNLSGIFAGEAPVSRTLYWRYLNMAQEACRSGNWKYLKILDNSFLFNVVDDPLERANMKDRRPDIYQDLINKFRKWDAAMLPLDPNVTTGSFSGADIADHFGVQKRRMTPDHTGN